jgi:hypothetical protein
MYIDIFLFKRCTCNPEKVEQFEKIERVIKWSHCYDVTAKCTRTRKHPLIMRAVVFGFGIWVTDNKVSVSDK